jgi:hypothetical protein
VTASWAWRRGLAGIRREQMINGPPAGNAYVARRTAQGLGKKEIIRCLKRYVVREVYDALIKDFSLPSTT